MDKDLGRAFNCRDFFRIAFSEICCLWGVKANWLMDKDLGRAFNCRDFFGLPSMR
jgi:hypothetical protein